MNNIELEQKIKELCAIENYFDMYEAIAAFEKEYKASDFYKNTKRPLEKVIKEARIHYALQLQDLEKKIQNLIDNLSLEHLTELLDKVSDIFTAENNEILEELNILKGLKD